jgi:hypothetical protein
VAGKIIDDIRWQGDVGTVCVSYYGGFLVRVESDPVGLHRGSIVIGPVDFGVFISSSFDGVCKALAREIDEYNQNHALMVGV